MSVKMRQMVERDIVGRVIDDLIAAGHTLSVYDGEETTLRRSTDKKAILKAMMTTDEDYLFLDLSANDEPTGGWVRFIYGNDGPDVINDYTTNLEPIMHPIYEWSEAKYGN